MWTDHFYSPEIFLRLALTELVFWDKLRGSKMTLGNLVQVDLTTLY